MTRVCAIGVNSSAATSTWRNNLIIHSYAFTTVDASTTNSVAQAFRRDETGLRWISQPLNPTDQWQRLYVELNSPITLTMVRIKVYFGPKIYCDTDH